MLINGIYCRVRGTGRELQAHIRKWSRCRECPLSKTRQKVVLLRGTIPTRYLFIGEAPGFSEDTLGEPFAGEAGTELDELLEAARELLDNNGITFKYYPWAISNIIACIPLDDTDMGMGIRQPNHKEATACRDRLRELINLVSPTVIFAMGKIAQKYLPPALEGNPRLTPNHIIPLIHPAAILRLAPSQAHLERKRFTVAVSTTVAQLERSLVCKR